MRASTQTLSRAHMLRAACVLACCVMCVTGTWVDTGAVMGVFGRALRSSRRPDRALNYEAQPLCGSTGPTLFPFAKERYAHTPIRIQALRDVTEQRTSCSIEITGRQWRALDALAEDEYWVYLEIDGLVAQFSDSANLRTRHGYKLARQHPLTVAKHLSIVIHYHTRANDSQVEVVKWDIAPTYTRLEPGAFEWTYTVQWRKAPPDAVRGSVEADGKLDTHVHGIQYVSMIVCFVVTLFVSAAMNITIRRFVAPYIVDGFTPLRHFDCGACFQLRNSSRARDVECPTIGGTLDEELCLMSTGEVGTSTGGPTSASASALSLNSAQWRFLVDDVFRPAAGGVGMTLACGVGVHLFLSTIMILVLGACGGDRHLKIAVWVCAMVAALPAGYVTGAIRYYLRAARVMHVAIAAGATAPGCIVVATLIANAALLAEDSVYAVPMKTAVFMLMSWWLITCLVFIGGFMAYRNKTQHPRTSAVQRELPKWSIADGLTTFLHGIGVWLGVATPMFIIISSVWTARVIHVSSMFILLLASLLMWMVLVSSFGIMFTYLTLNRGRWRWAGPSFYGAAMSAAPSVFLFTAYYVSNQFQGAMGKIVYVCQAVAAICTTSLSAGAVSLLSSTLFVRALYGTARLA